MFRFIRTILRSLRLYLVIMFPGRHFHFRLRKSPGIRILEGTIQTKHHVLKPDIYRPCHKTKNLRPAIIVYVPLAQEGKRDQLVTNFMEGLAHLGYIVMVPFWPDRIIGTIAETDREDFIESLNWLRDQPDVDPRRIGVVAVSYGAAPVLRALTDSAIAAKVQFVSLIGGLFDLRNLAEFALTNRFSYQKIARNLKPDSYLTRILYRAGAAYLKAPSDKQYFLALADSKKPASKPPLTPAGQKVAALFATREPERFPVAYRELPAGMRTWLAELSPAGKLGPIKLPILILHSTNDELVPYTESLRLYDELRSNGQTTLTLVDIFEHTVPVSATPWSIFRIYLPNLRRVVRYVHHILSFQEK